MTPALDSSLKPYTDEEVPLRPTVRDLRLSSGRRLALITLVGDGRRPTTMGAAGLAKLAGVLETLSRRAAAGDLDAVGVVGHDRAFAAGADLRQLRRLSPDAALQIGRLGHRVLSRLGTLGVPSFAFLTGLALGGGLELALHCTYRTAALDAGPIGLPEVSLGLIPGWGGTYLLPQLTGIDTPVADVEQALAPLAMPMGPFQLMQLIGWRVSAHMLDTMVSAFPDRFHTSANLHRLADTGAALTIVQGRVTGWDATAAAALTLGSTPVPDDQLLRRTQDGLTREVSIMLAEQVVESVEDVDLCLILGAGWPCHHGGLTPWLDATGSTNRLLGDTFHHPPVAGARLPALSAIGTS